MVDGPLNVVGEAFDTLTQPILLRQFVALSDQRLPLRFEGTLASFQFLAATLKLIVFDKSRLVEICKAPPLGSSQGNLAIEPSELSNEQIVVACLRRADTAASPVSRTSGCGALL